MLKIGIFAPYVRNETTLAATQFADWLVRCGFEVVYLADGKVASGISSHWDTQVKSSHNVSLYKWGKGLTHVCWFSVNSFVMSAIQLVAPNDPKRTLKHFFFPTWKNWTLDEEGMFLVADKVICLNHSLKHWINRKYGSDKTKWKRLVSPAIITFPKVGRVNPKTKHLCVVLSKSVVLDLGLDLLHVFNCLLDGHQNLHVTFILEHTLPKGYRKELSRTKDQHPDRVEILGSPAYQDWPGIIRQHDWVYLSTTRHTYGSLLTHCASAGVPIIAHDVAPVTEHIEDRVSGVVIPAEIIECPAPVAEVDIEDVMVTLERVLSNHDCVLEDHQADITLRLKTKQESFARFINQEFLA